MTTTLASCIHCGATGTYAKSVWRQPMLLHPSAFGEFVLVNGIAVEASAKSDEAGLTRWREHVCQPAPAKTTMRKARKGNKR